MSPFRQVAPDFYVAPQLEPEDLRAAKAQGIRTVINNRPDGEAPDQLADAEARAAAAAEGLDYAYVPVISGGLRAEDVTAMQEAIAGHPGPWLAWCRSGTRSCHLWALARAGETSPDALIEAAATAGYDLTAIRPLLEALHARGSA